MPLCNIPMIDYTIEMLASSGIQEACFNSPMTLLFHVAPLPHSFSPFRSISLRATTPSSCKTTSCISFFFIFFPSFFSLERSSSPTLFPSFSFFYSKSHWCQVQGLRVHVQVSKQCSSIGEALREVCRPLHKRNKNTTNIVTLSLLCLWNLGQVEESLHWRLCVGFW